MGSARRVRSAGAGRPARRGVSRGGTGVAADLNAALATWPRVRITPTFGRWGYFLSGRLFGCFPLRAKDTDLWIRLTPDEQRRALADPGVTPHRRFARRGWVECRVTGPTDVARALRWLRRGYEAIRREVEAEERAGG